MPITNELSDIAPHFTILQIKVFPIYLGNVRR